MRFDGARVIGWAIPLVCIGIAAILIVRGYDALQSANQELAVARLQESSASTTRDLAERKSGLMRFAAIPPSTSEEPKFLNGLRSHAAQLGIRITRWTGHPPEPMAPKPSASQSSDEKPMIDPAIKTTVQIKGEVTLQGPYRGIRDFLNVLERSTRLYVLSEMRWIRKDSEVELTTTVTRYVDPTLTPADVVPGNPRRS